MASELRITTLANNAGTEKVDTKYPINGSVKSWIDFAGNPVSIADSFSYSSVTDNGTGNYTPTTSISMASANYSCVFGGSFSGASDPRFMNAYQNAATTQRVKTANTSSSSALDWQHIQLANLGDLA